MNRKALRVCAGLGIGTILAANPARAAVTVDFESPTAFTDNFRKLAGTATPVMSANGADNDFLSINPATTLMPAYDTTPADGAVKNTFAVAPGAALGVSADVRFATTNSSLGVYITDPADETKGYLAIFNVNAPSVSGNDQIRFASNGNPATGGAGTLVNGKSDGNALDLATWGTVNVTYAIDANNHPVLSIGVGAYTDSVTFTDISTPLTNVEVVFRLAAQAGSGTYDFDNVTITPAAAPEPASAALLGLAALPALARRRRR
jgi:hypothetical protein